MFIENIREATYVCDIYYEKKTGQNNWLRWCTKKRDERVSSVIVQYCSGRGICRVIEERLFLFGIVIISSGFCALVTPRQTWISWYIRRNHLWLTIFKY